VLGASQGNRDDRLVLTLDDEAAGGRGRLWSAASTAATAVTTTGW
jgi:hypothetical protein